MHGSVSLLLADTGSATASYGYRPYGDADDELTAGDFDPSDRTESAGLLDNPLNAYRYSAKRFDSGSGSIDMGARRFGPDTARFLQRDNYNRATADLGLALDPLTQNRYALASGNPISFVEWDGHVAYEGAVDRVAGTRIDRRGPGAKRPSAARLTRRRDVRHHRTMVRPGSSVAMPGRPRSGRS